MQSDITPIAAKVAGYIDEVPVQDFERVVAGQIMAHISDSDFTAAVELVQANLESAVAQVEALKAQRVLQHSNIQAAGAAVASVAATLEQNQRDIVRQQRLLESGSSSTEATERIAMARAQLTAQLAQVRALAQSTMRQVQVLDAQEAHNVLVGMDHE